jgi:hypothetical protein
MIDFAVRRLDLWNDDHGCSRAVVSAKPYVSFEKEESQ